MVETACSECGIVSIVEKKSGYYTQYCPRCGASLYSNKVSRTFVGAMAFTTLCLFIPLIFLPVLNVNFMGHRTTATLFEALWNLVADGEYVIVFVSIITALVTPFVMMLFMLFMLFAPSLDIEFKRVLPVYKAYEFLKEWGMADVYFIAILVSMIKLAEKSMLEIGAGLYLFALFSLCFYITNRYYNPDEIWREYEE